MLKIAPSMPTSHAHNLATYHFVGGVNLCLYDINCEHDPFVWEHIANHIVCSAAY